MVRGEYPSPDAGGVRRHALTLFNNMAEGLVICEAIRDADGRLVDYWIRAANPIFLARAPEGASAIGRTLLSMRPGTSEWWFRRCEAALEGEEVRFEFQDPNSHRWYDAHMMRLSDEEFGQYFMDITHRKAAETRQAELFDELNHRVKNNLATVASVLELHARSAPPEVRAHLEDAIGRVRTISDLHTVLYQQHSTEEVDLCAYLDALCAGLRSALFHEPGFRLETRCDAVSVATREAVSLGLIANELVTNAAKHAFVGRSSGRVEVELASIGPGLRLRVRDDGVGASRSAPSSEGLGLRLVRSLAAGLGAQLEMVDHAGLCVEITISDVQGGAKGAGSS